LPRIKIGSEEVWGRGPRLRELLAPLTRGSRGGGPPYEALPRQNRIIFAVRDAKTSGDYSKWRIRTFHSSFIAAYHEEWVPIEPDTQDEWFLKRAYLTIFRVNRKLMKEEEFLCLHCDPEEGDSSTSTAIYKQGPHLHIKAASHPIPKAHLALAHAFIDQVLASDDDLFTVVRKGIELICDEILMRL